MYPWIILLILCSRYCQCSELLCDVTEYEKDGRCCSLCRPGKWLLRDCTKQNDTVCITCSAGEYQDKYHRETSCLLHKECNEQLGFEKISEGNLTTNANCRCQVGKHCSSAACETCVLNKVCGPGEGVVQRATSVSDTKCSPCNVGTYSDTESEIEPCKDWSKCGEEEVTIQPGTPTTDLKCGPRPPTNQSNAWIYIVVFVGVFVAIVLPVVIFVRKSKLRKKIRKDPPEEHNPQQLIKPKEDNLPEEDQDDQDITMQGLPVAQEQGKDYHMSQEEV
ncbi:tumor necrosis factor receptor superfamily member 5 [Bufo gargarizans]|uniref:tumor necrosis factor receptor superfamily member 5 n=1 Tax=Bufo gargarizans TaxID=30331 RepID=UPI001CF2FEC1|nr:tumor necrosis factor receptor superfamily member 5 [Bufo gargarizans]